MAKKTAAILGATGFTGVELLRLIAQHPEMDVVYASGDSQAGEKLSNLYPSLRAAYPSMVAQEFSQKAVSGVDVVFLGLPHESSVEIVPQLLGDVGCVVDLSAAFRLRDTAQYPQWYGFTHEHPEYVAQAVYGLPEIYRKELAGAQLIATPGCYVTAATLALRPFVRGGIFHPEGLIVDAASGVSGAGKALKSSSMFASVDEDFSAYGLVSHRHTPEMEQEIGGQVLFTPHLAPMNRGIFATCYARPAKESSPTSASLVAVLARAYAKEDFVVVGQQIPSTKATFGTNVTQLTARFDERTGYVVVLAALDNLAKGASGGAVQAANAALGLPEDSGLSKVGIFP